MKKASKGHGRGVSRRDFIKGLGTAAVLPNLIAQEATGTRTAGIPIYDRKKISLRVNGIQRTLDVEPRETLLDVLRGRIGLTGAKKVCDRGECGGCTVLLDGEPVYSCLFLAIRADGRSVTTVEGMADGDRLHPVQEAFIEKDAYQCGFCAPGFIMASTALLTKTPNPTPDEIKEGLSGNLCRCGNYQKIFEAVAAASAKTGRP